MNKKDYARIVTLYNAGRVPSKLIVEMILHHCTTSNPSISDAISIAAVVIDRFYREEVKDG